MAKRGASTHGRIFPEMTRDQDAGARLALACVERELAAAGFPDLLRCDKANPAVSEAIMRGVRRAGLGLIASGLTLPLVRIQKEG